MSVGDRVRRARWPRGRIGTIHAILGDRAVVQWDAVAGAHYTFTRVRLDRLRSA